MSSHKELPDVDEEGKLGEKEPSRKGSTSRKKKSKVGSQDKERVSPWKVKKRSSDSHNW